MLISDKHHTRHISKDRISQYIEFALSNKYSTDSREIDPMHVLEWVAEVVKNEDSSLYESCHFKATYYFLIKESKYPMALFLKLLHIRILLDRCKVVDTKVFSYLFEIFLKASKQYATDPKSREILNELPDEIPEDRDKFKGWFLTITNRSFRISSIIDLYIWIVEQGLTINFNNQKNLVDVLNDYLKFLKANYTHSKYKKMRIYIVYLVTFLQGVKEKVELLNNDTQVIITKFANYKTAGIPIFFESQKISDSKWKPTNSIHGQKILKTFITKVIKSRGCTEIGISEFSVFSLTLTDYLGVKVSRNESHTLRQFIPWLLENHTIEECDRAQLMHLYKRMPKAATSTFIAGDGNFISRRDFIVIITTAFRTCQKKTKLKFVIYLCLVGFLALRLSEAVQIQIGDFELDERGLLRDVGNGFGTLVLPAFKSKGGYSPSFKPYNIAVVPKLRDIINMYLETDFMKFHTPETYLLRPNAVREYDPLFDKVPNHIKNALEYALWLDKARDCGEAIALDMFRRTKNQMEQKLLET